MKRHHFDNRMVPAPHSSPRLAAILGAGIGLAGLIRVGVASCPAPSFGPPTYYNTGSRSTAVAVGDLNQDGRPDLVVGDRSAAKIHILLGRGDGRFDMSGTYDAAAGMLMIALADLNHDGRQDVVLTCYPDPGIVNQTTVWLGNGDGTLSNRHDYSPGPNQVTVAIADYNGDGHPDLAFSIYGASNTDASRVAILDGKGDGTFWEPARVIQTGCCGTYSVLASDFDADGRMDLVVGNNESQVLRFLKGKGDGTFEAPVDLWVKTGNAYGLTAGDFDGDGRMDFAVANGWAQRVVVLKGTGDGSFTIMKVIPLNGVPESIQTVDCTADGYPDLVVGLAAGSAVAVIPGDGAGHFGPPVQMSVSGNPEAVAVGDFNADGAPDIAVASSSGKGVGVLLNLCVPLPPRILHQPRQVVLTEGAPGQIEVELGGDPPTSLQWSFNGQPMGGANTNPLSFSAVTRAAEGVYTVAVTNQFGHATSEPIIAIVSNVVPLPVVDLRWQGSNAGPVNLEYTLQLREPVAWLSRSNYPASDTIQVYREMAPAQSKCFYRLNGPQALRFSVAGLVNGWSMTGPAGSRVRVEYVTIASGWTNWQTLTTLTLPTSPYPFVDEASLNDPARVYRTTVVP